MALQEPVLLAMADLQGQWPQALQLHAHRLHTAARACGPGARAAATAAAGVRRCLTHMGCGSLLQDVQSPAQSPHALPGSSPAAGFLTPAYLSTQHAARAGLVTAAAAASAVGAWDVPEVRARTAVASLWRPLAIASIVQLIERALFAAAPCQIPRASCISGVTQRCERLMGDPCGTGCRRWA